MNTNTRVACALVALLAAGPSFAKDFFWNCTTPLGTKYADATRCDTGDIGVRVVKGGQIANDGRETRAAGADVSAKPGPSMPATALVDQAQANACPKTLSDCARPDDGVVHASPRTQAIAQFMRRKECEFLLRFPKRCVNPN